jgi:DNA-binding response OmpR family regulator
VRRAAGGASPVLRQGEITLDVGAGVATVSGRPVDLTAREIRILGYLMHRVGRIVSQAELIDHVYAMDDLRESNTIEVYIARLRKKLGRDAIRTIRGLGYRMG